MNEETMLSIKIALPDLTEEEKEIVEEAVEEAFQIGIEIGREMEVHNAQLQ